MYEFDKQAIGSCLEIDSPSRGRKQDDADDEDEEESDRFRN